MCEVDDRGVGVDPSWSSSFLDSQATLSESDPVCFHVHPNWMLVAAPNFFCTIARWLIGLIRIATPQVRDVFDGQSRRVIWIHGVYVAIMVHNLTPEVFTCLHPFLSAGYMNTSIPYTFSLFNAAWNNYCIVRMVTLLCTAQKAHIWIKGIVWPKHCDSFHPDGCVHRSGRQNRTCLQKPHNGKSVEDLIVLFSHEDHFRYETYKTDEDNPSGLPIDLTSRWSPGFIRKSKRKLSCSVSLGVPIWGGIGLCFTKNVCMYLSHAFTCPFLKIASEFIIWVLLI